MIQKEISDEQILHSTFIIDDLNKVIITCLLAKAGLSSASDNCKLWLASLSDADRRKLESCDIYPGRTEVFEEYVKLVQLDDINVFGLLQFAIVMESFITRLLELAIIAQGVPEQDIQREVECHLRTGFSRQLKIINTVAHLTALPSFPKYREMRACRNTIVHSQGRIGPQYLKEANKLARGRLGEMIVVDDAYLQECLSTCVHLSVEACNELIWRRRGQCRHSKVPAYAIGKSEDADPGRNS